MPRRKRRPNRADEARTNEAPRAETRAREWVRPSQLEAPEPRPGYRQKWIRMALHGKEEPHHVANRTREGWEPRKADTAPDFPSSKEGLIETGGLILCEMPEPMVEQRNAYYQRKNELQNSAVEQDLNRVAEPHLPIHQTRKSKSETGFTPKVADD